MSPIIDTCEIETSNVRRRYLENQLLENLPVAAIGDASFEEELNTSFPNLNISHGKCFK